MAKDVVEKDEFLPDGTALFNASKPHGLVYGHSEVRYEQGGVQYGADRKPVGYVPKQGKDASAKTS